MSTNEFTGQSETISEGVRFLTLSQLLERIPISRATANRYIKKGVIPTVRLGKRILVEIGFLEQLKDRSVFPGKEAKE
jgi:predicted DNA-binding transcriptional regulator AlpA